MAHRHKVHRAKKAGGGVKKDYYAGGNSNVREEADERKHGGSVPAKAKKHSLHAEGNRPRRRLDKPYRGSRTKRFDSGGAAGPPDPISSSIPTPRPPMILGRGPPAPPPPYVDNTMQQMANSLIGAAGKSLFNSDKKSDNNKSSDSSDSSDGQKRGGRADRTHRSRGK